MDSITNHEWSKWPSGRTLTVMNKARALIVGGGLGGPALALFLQRAGIESKVIEAYPRADHVGGSFQIAPNGVRVLAELGLADALLHEGHPSHAFCFRNHHGKVIARARTDRSGAAINVGRPPLQRLLRDELERRDVPVFYGKRVRSVAKAGREVVVELEDGSTEVGDFLVAADGVHSRIRACIFPEHAKARDTEMVAVGGFCRADYAPPPDLGPDSELTFIVGPKHQLGYGKFGPTMWAWWCHALAETEEKRAALTRASTDALRRTMEARYAGWSAPVSDLLASTEATIATPIFDVPHLPTWHSGRVVLMADAAHAMSPAGGQGASMALADAMLLARLLAREATPEEAFVHFEGLRKKAAQAFVKQGYANDRRSLHESGPVGTWLRDNVLMPMFAPVMTRILEKHYAAPLGA
jgi:2-polyprenyl-6-methoxyphenol hydroxylase-like FAD-dependent oxidoreductase